MYRLLKDCLILLIMETMYFSAAGCTNPPSSGFPQSGTPTMDIEPSESGSLFASADENKLRREKSMASDIARSLSQLKGVARARLHLTLADNSILSNSPEKHSRAALLIVHFPGAAPDEKILRNFVLAAVPDLADENLQILFTPAEASSEKNVTVAGLQVEAESATQLKTILAVLLSTTVVAAVALIFAGISIRRLRRSHRKSAQT